MSPERATIVDMDLYTEKNIEPKGDCWEWQGYINPDGYGIAVRKIGDKWKQIRAHRHVYEELIGRIPDGLQLDHLCRNKKCVNPSHLEPVTQVENNRRIFNAFNISEKTCINGHDYTPESTKPRGKDRLPVCRICDNNRPGRLEMLRRRREKYKTDPEYRAHRLTYNKANREQRRGKQ